MRLDVSRARDVLQSFNPDLKFSRLGRRSTSLLHANDSRASERVLDDNRRASSPASGGFPGDLVRRRVSVMSRSSEQTSEFGADEISPVFLGESIHERQPPGFP